MEALLLCCDLLNHSYQKNIVCLSLKKLGTAALWYGTIVKVILSISLNNNVFSTTFSMIVYMYSIFYRSQQIL